MGSLDLPFERDPVKSIRPFPRGRSSLALLCLWVSLLSGCGSSRPSVPGEWGAGEVKVKDRSVPVNRSKKSAKEEDAVLSGREKRDLLKSKKSG